MRSLWPCGCLYPRIVSAFRPTCESALTSLQFLFPKSELPPEQPVSTFHNRPRDPIETKRQLCKAGILCTQYAQLLASYRDLYPANWESTQAIRVHWTEFIACSRKVPIFGRPRINSLQLGRGTSLPARPTAALKSATPPTSTIAGVCTPRTYKNTLPTSTVVSLHHGVRGTSKALQGRAYRDHCVKL